MNQPRSFLVSTLVSGLLIVVPVYLAVLLLLKAMGSVMGLVRPVARRGATRGIAFSRIPGFALLQSLTHQLAGYGDKVWKPALVEIEDALVPGFLIEELDDGRMTVFVPSVPTPLAGAVYVLDRQRVHGGRKSQVWSAGSWCPVRLDRRFPRDQSSVRAAHLTRRIGSR